MTFEEIREMHDRSLMPAYGRFPVAIQRGRGAVAEDVDGRRYIDFGSGIGANVLGYCEEGWVKAVSAQLNTLQHISNLYYSPVQIALADELCRRTGMARAFLSNSGAEANECAIKLARKASRDRFGEGRSTVLTLTDSFHGRTVTTLSAAGQESLHRDFFPFTEGFRHVPPNDIGALEREADGSVCAVMLECVQGEGGVLPLDDGYLRAVRALCDEKGWLLIDDEVQTGIGRTGKLLCCQHAGVVPDIVTLAKGLGGGLPIGATLCVDCCGEVLTPGTHGSTFGGNPVVCAGARYVLGVVDTPAFLEEVTRKGEILRSRLREMPHIAEVRGRGMMVGAELCDGVTARALAEAALANGLLVLTAKAALRLLPPLNIPEDLLRSGLDILEHTLKEMA